MVRVERAIKIAINIGACLILLTLLYVLNSGENQMSSNARSSAISDYDYYMDEYKDVAAYDDDVFQLSDDDVAADDDVADVDDGDGAGKMIDDVTSDKDEEGEKPRGSVTSSSDNVAVVLATEKPDKDKPKEEKNKAHALDAPSLAKGDDINILPGDDDVSDVLVDDVGFDTSEELIIAAGNASLESLQRLMKGEGNITHYAVEHLMSVLQKPPPDRQAPGEYGQPFEVPKRMGPSVERQIEEGYRRHAFNVLVSDIISVHRVLGDLREDVCKETKFKIPLPTTTVIICYRNEAFSTLIRTIYSVLESVPAILLTELVIVDDASHQDLFEAVKKEVEELDMVRLIRSPQQVGIVRARMMALKEATGDVVVFMDSHCECYEGWLEPLLDRIRENRRVVAMPIMEIINPDNFKFSLTPMHRAQRGGFDWSLTYRWIQPDRERFQNAKIPVTKPIRSATMSGGVFAIERKFFDEMGGFDMGMKLFGGENLEMSFRMWMCGGRIEIIPCSHVGHVFKSRSTHSVPLDVVMSNKLRVADVWMDEYKKMFMKRTPAARDMRSGNTTSRMQLREKLKCKKFSWYIDNIYPDLYIPELNPQKSGAICCRFGDEVNVCIDTRTPDAVPGRPPSISRFEPQLVTQYFEFTKQREFRQAGIRDLCLGVNGLKLEIQRCKYPADQKVAPESQQWIMNENGGLVNVETKSCLTASMSDVTLQACQPKTTSQIWKWISDSTFASMRDL